DHRAAFCALPEDPGLDRVVVDQRRARPEFLDAFAPGQAERAAVGGRSAGANDPPQDTTLGAGNVAQCSLEGCGAGREERPQDRGRESAERLHSVAARMCRPGNTSVRTARATPSSIRTPGPRLQAAPSSTPRPMRMRRAYRSTRSRRRMTTCE